MISEVFHIDCNEYMKNIPDKFFDIVIVDPPYAINAPNLPMGSWRNTINTAVRIKKGRLNQGAGKLKNRNIQKMDIDWDFEKPSVDYFNELFRISKHQIIWGGNYFDLPPTRCIICWDKCQPWDNFSQWEMAWTSFDKPAKMYRISNTGGNNKIKKIHPTQKPVQLYKNIYRDFCNPNFKVFDSHLGSGTNRIAASDFGISYFVGCETSKFYIDEHNKMYNNHIKQLKLF